MAYDSYVEYNGTGSKTDFTITFNYLSQTVVLPPSTPAGIKVYVSDVQQTTGYTVTGSNIVFDTAPASGTKNVIIKRVTPRGHGDRLVNFAAGATLSAADLETSQLQNLYIAQEAWEQGSEDSVVTTSTTSIDADSITANELAPDSVGDSELKDDAIAIANMQNNSVSTAELVDDSVTFAKLKETDFVAGSFTAAADTFLRFNRSNGNIVDPLTEGSQVKVADITDFQSSVNAKALSDFTGTTADDLDLNDNKIENLATPTAATDAATKSYVDGFLPLKYTTFTATAAQAVSVEAGDDDIPVHVLTGTIPSDVAFITSVSWSIDVTDLSYSVGTDDDAAVNAYIHFEAFDVTDLPATFDNTIMAYWASQQGVQESAVSLAGTNFGGSNYSQTPDVMANVVKLLNGTPTSPGEGSRVIPMFQAYDASLTPSITVLFYRSYQNDIEADDTVTITHDTTVAITYIPS